MTKFTFTLGDDVAKPIRIKRNGAYLDITGYSFETYFRDADGEIYTVPNEDHEIDEDQEINTGRLVINIASAVTATFKAVNQGTLIVKVTNPSGKSVHYRGTGILYILEVTP